MGGLHSDYTDYPSIALDCIVLQSILSRCNPLQSKKALEFRCLGLQPDCRIWRDENSVTFLFVIECFFKQTHRVYFFTGHPSKILSVEGGKIPTNKVKVDLSKYEM